MAQTAAQEDSRWNWPLSASIRQLTTGWVYEFRPDWCSADTSAHLQKLEKLFTKGVLLGLTESDQLLHELGLDRGVEAILVEGAAMGLAMLDLMFPARLSRWQRLADDLGSPHIYAVHAGYGMAAARLGKPLPKDLDKLAPLFRWLVADGYAFHHGYTEPDKYIRARRRIPMIPGTPYALEVFDQGLGRALWFVFGGKPVDMRAAVGAFEPERQSDLWSGIGLACAHAGLAGEEILHRLRDDAGTSLPHLALGAVLAAKIRSHANSPMDHTDLACRIFCGVSGAEAAAIADQSAQGLPTPDCEPAYAAWRRNIRSHFS